MTLLEAPSVEEAKIQLEEIVKPFQQEQHKRQKKSDFLKKCIQCIEKNDFFQLDELLKSKQASELLEDTNFESCKSIFSHLQTWANEQIENYRLQYKDGLAQIAEEAGLSMAIDLPRFSILKGIEGKIDFPNRTTVINQTTLKSIDPKRIIMATLNIKKKLYDLVFEPQKFIDALFDCYNEILKKSNQGLGNSVPVSQLYTEYVWSLQNKNFFQNMDKAKFKGYSIEQFAVDLWRYFKSDISAAKGGYRFKFNPGRGKVLWLIDQDGEKRQITHASFVKN